MSGLQVLNDSDLLDDVVAVVETAAAKLAERFSADGPRPSTPDEVVAAIDANDDAVNALLQEPLLAARPGSRWVDDELAGGTLPPGEWWVTDPAEGNINHVHGLPEFAVTATLVRDNLPVLTVVCLPLVGSTYTAVAGQGAWQDGVALHASAKTELALAMVGTGQASPAEDAETFRRIGESVTAMLNTSAVLKVSVPATLQLIHVAAGRADVFWQFSDVRSGLAAGALLVAEAGGSVTDTHGVEWSLASTDFLATAPGLRDAAVSILSAIR
jgi:myo-inositol-1(or 4)-monophosphatase